MKKGLVFLTVLLALSACEAGKATRLEGFWVNRNTESSRFDRKAVYFAPFDGVPENSENYRGVYRIGYLSNGEVEKQSIAEGWWRIVFAPSQSSSKPVYALFLAPDGNVNAEQRFELRFDGDRLILADLEKPEVAVERYSRVHFVNGL